MQMVYPKTVAEQTNPLHSVENFPEVGHTLVALVFGANSDSATLSAPVLPLLYVLFGPHRYIHTCMCMRTASSPLGARHTHLLLEAAPLTSLARNPQFKQNPRRNRPYFEHPFGVFYPRASIFRGAD